MTTECFQCGAPATRSFGKGYICDDCIPDSGGSESRSEESTGENTSDEKSQDRNTPKCGEAADRDRDHENPIDVADVTDGERAEMLREYIDAFVDEFGRGPLLIPLDSPVSSHCSDK